MGQVGGHPVGRHRVLGQGVGADRQEVDDLEHPVGEQRRARHLHHHPGAQPVGVHLVGERRGLGDRRDHRRHHLDLGAFGRGRFGDREELVPQQGGVLSLIHI